MRRKNILFVAIASFSLIASSLAAYIAVKNVNPRFNMASNQVEGTITFENHGDNIVQTPSVEPGYYDEMISTISDNGTKFYCLVSEANDLEGANDKIANLFDSTIMFLDANQSVCKFQSLTSFYVELDVSRDITISTSNDGVNYSDSYVCTDDDGRGTFMLHGARYFRFSLNGSMYAGLIRVAVNYSCSYDYVEPVTQKVTIYASNDFHGAVQETYDRAGLEKYATFFKNHSEDENTLLIDQGDTWQGSIYSNINYGNLVNDVMIEAGWDVRTIGNHDFDWGVDRLKANTARQYKGQTLTTLAANIYDYNFSTKTFGTTQQAEIGGKTATFTLENGLKVGVVGVIGSEQITSINSLYTHDIGFKDHVAVIKEEATNLRNDDCDIVIASIHADQDAVLGQGLANYVDLVLCAHSHQHEINTGEGITYAQFSSNGEMAGKIELYYDPATHKVTSTTTTSIYAYQIKDDVTEIDPAIHSLVSTANASCEEQANEVVASNVVALPDHDSNFSAGNVAVDTQGPLHYYVYDGDVWTKGGRIIRDQDLGYYWYHWFNGSLPEDPQENEYYINYQTGDYYVYESGTYVKLGELVPGGAPTNIFTFSSSFVKGQTLEDLMARAIYDKAIEEGYTDIVCSYVNDARVNEVLQDPVTNSITYADIYNAFPFDNEVYIIEVTGREMMNEVYKYNYAYFSEAFTNNGKGVELDKKYKIACLDYLAFHTNSSRDYDYFDENNGNYVGVLSKNYRLLLKDWLKDEGYTDGRRLNSDEFSKTLARFNRSNLHIEGDFTLSFEMNDGSYVIYNQATHVPYNAYVVDYLPAVDPTRDGYTFQGWYRDRAGNYEIGSLRVTQDRTFYAKWQSADIYETGQLNYLTFIAGTTQTTAYASNGVDSVQVTFDHTEIGDNSKYSEFTIFNNGYVTMTAPSGYIIVSVEAKQYSTHSENLIFYSGTSASVGNELYDNVTNVDGNCIHSIQVNGASFYMQEKDDSYATHLFYIAVSLEKL